LKDLNNVILDDDDDDSSGNDDDDNDDNNDDNDNTFCEIISFNFFISSFSLLSLLVVLS